MKRRSFLQLLGVGSLAPLVYKVGSSHSDLSGTAITKLSEIPHGIVMSAEGTKMRLNNGDRYNLTTPWDMSTMTYDYSL